MSQDTASRQTLGRTLAGMLALLAIAVLLDIALAFALEPRPATPDIWTRYRLKGDKPLDAIVCGSSFAIQGISPQVLDSGLGSQTFDFAGYGGSLDNAYLAVSEACEDHDITRVWLGMSYETLATETDPDILRANLLFTFAKMQGEPLPAQLGDLATLFSNPQVSASTGSVGYLFPWTLNHVELNPQAISENVSAKLADLRTEEPYPEFDYEADQGTGPLYDTSMTEEELVGQAGEPNTVLGAYATNERNFSRIADIARVCAAHGARLYVVGTPRHKAEVERFGPDWAATMGRLREVVEAEGGTFIDATALDPSVYEPPAAAEFADRQHLNLSGRDRFSEALVALVTRLEAGERIDDLTLPYA